MSTKTPLIIAALLLAATTACQPGTDADTDTAATDAATPADAGAPDAMPPGSAMPDATDPAAGTAAPGEALAFLVVVNEHEIAAAEQARDKQLDAKVRAYADMLHADHSKNLAETRAVADSAGAAVTDTPDVDAQRQKGKDELEQLGGLEGDAYAKAYLDAMVKGHNDALVLIDTRLVPAATDEAIKQHLNTTRDAIAKHLEEAKQLQAAQQ